MMRTIHVAVLATLVGLLPAAAFAQTCDNLHSAGTLRGAPPVEGCAGAAAGDLNHPGGPAPFGAVVATYSYSGSQGLSAYRKMPDRIAPEATIDVALGWRPPLSVPTAMGGTVVNGARDAGAVTVFDGSPDRALAPGSRGARPLTSWRPTRTMCDERR